MPKSHRNTIKVCQAKILEHVAHEGEQFFLRIYAPNIAQTARAGSFAHITCDANRPLRRPISIMGVNRQSGTVDFLYKRLGEGTRLLAEKQESESISVLGPIGTPFTPHMEKRRPLLIGGGVGMPPMIFLADALREIPGAYDPLVILGSEVPFPFKAQPSSIMVPGLPAHVTAAMPLLEQWNTASRLCSLQDFAGCHQGYVTELARHWLDALSEEERKEVEIFACGPHPMLDAVAALAREYKLPCQVSMEEFMACGVGGCAGCVVEVQTPQGPAMKRVCVDGPVFDARAVFPSE